MCTIRQGLQALLSDPQMCSFCGDKPGLAVGLLILFQELFGGESSGPSAVEEQRSCQKLLSLLRSLALTQPRWWVAVGSLEASGVQILQQRQCSKRLPWTAGAVPAKGFPRSSSH